MIVVVVLGVLAAVAITGYFKFIQRSKTSECFEKLSMLYRESARYALDSNESVMRGADDTAVGMQFPRTEPLTPVVSCCASEDRRCEPSWDYWETPTWRALDFNIADPHWFRFAYESSGTGPGALFTARAQADLDCDGTLSTYERCGQVTSDLNVIGAPGVFRRRPLE